MSILATDLGATYISEGMIFVIIECVQDFEGGSMVRVLLLDDNDKYGRPIPGGTVMQVEYWTKMWHEARRIASPGERCKVAE